MPGRVIIAEWILKCCFLSLLSTNDPSPWHLSLELSRPRGKCSAPIIPQRKPISFLSAHFRRMLWRLQRCRLSRHHYRHMAKLTEGKGRHYWPQQSAVAPFVYLHPNALYFASFGLIIYILTETFSSYSGRKSFKD